MCASQQQCAGRLKCHGFAGCWYHFHYFKLSAIKLCCNMSSVCCTCRLVAVLDARVHVHALQTLGQLRVIETPQNPKGLAALTPCSEPCCYLALPASAAAGVLRVYDLLTDGGHVVCEVQVRVYTMLQFLNSFYNSSPLRQTATLATMAKRYADSALQPWRASTLPEMRPNIQVCLCLC
jgi:hypothetical protein